MGEEENERGLEEGEEGGIGLTTLVHTRVEGVERGEGEAGDLFPIGFCRIHPMRRRARFL